MPPRLLPGQHFIDTVEAAGLGSAPVGPVPSDQYAAMPSLHLAWATWVAYYGSLIAGAALLRWLWRIYPFITAAVVVSTANHYVLDIVAGVAVAAVSVPAGARLSAPSEASSAATAGAGSPVMPQQLVRGSGGASGSRGRAHPAEAEPTP
jgi:hypothetical protein